MNPDLKGFLIAASFFLLAVLFSGCATKKIPILKPGELAKISSDDVEPAKRPPKREPADTPQGQVAKQWGADRKGWGDTADKSDTKSCILCAERGNKVIDTKTGENTCLKLNCGS